MADIKYYPKVRMHNNGTLYISLPAEEAYKLVKENKLILRSELVGKEVKVEVTL